LNKEEIEIVVKIETGLWFNQNKKA
jgi:hypothetical protein